MNAQRKIVIASIVLAFFFIGAVMFAAFPLVKGVLDDAKRLSEKKQELVLLREQEKNKEEFARIVSVKAADLQKLSALFLDPGNPTNFLEFIESAASKNQFLLTTIPASPQKLDQDAWPSIEFQISSKGSYGNLLPFLKNIEQGSFLAEFKSVNITKDEGGVRFSLFIKAYTK